MGVAGVWLPDALDRKYPNAGRELGWFWRHHLSESVIQKAVKVAALRARAGKATGKESP